MSQSWAKEQAKIRRKNKKNPPPSNPQFAAPVSYARLERLQAIARNEHMEGPDTKLPIEVKDELTEEWLMIVEEAFTRFDSNLKCSRCHQKHECLGMQEVLSDLKEEMEATDVEEINEEVVEAFQNQFESVWKVYVAESDGSTCTGDDAE